MRGKRAVKRKIEPDLKYNDIEVAKFINYIMLDGKKTVAQRVVYDAFEIIKDVTKQDPRHVFSKAIKNVAPLVEVRGKRVGGANYQVPFQVRGDRRYQLAFRWILASVRSRGGKSTAKLLADELLAAFKGEGNAIKKREDVHRMAESNKAFAHFAR
jgi:small subunit ribosomal protein S7